jgi:NADH-ubiquinone oxidoreductase chain 1
LFPIFGIFFIAAVAETNRAPFDLAEAESELVSGFMTEHAAVIFVFFFLAEYASIILICILISIIFLGGYEFFNLNNILLEFIVLPKELINGLLQYNMLDNYYFTKEQTLFTNEIEKYYKEFLYLKINENYSLLQNLFYGLIISIKSCSLVFAFI